MSPQTLQMIDNPYTIHRGLVVSLFLHFTLLCAENQSHPGPPETPGPPQDYPSIYTYHESSSAKHLSLL